MKTIQIQITFSIEGRDGDGTKKAVWHSSTGIPDEGEDPRLARLHLKRQVLAATYTDAVRLGIMDPGRARDELKAHLEKMELDATKLGAGL